MKTAKLLDFNLGAGFLKLLLGIGRSILGHALQKRGRSAVNLLLGFLQAEAGQSADDLDDADLVGAGLFQNNVELSLLFLGE